MILWYKMDNQDEIIILIQNLKNDPSLKNTLNIESILNSTPEWANSRNKPIEKIINLLENTNSNQEIKENLPNINPIDYKQIANENQEILSTIEPSLGAMKILDFQQRLKDYMYIEELHELRLNRYIRWINLRNTNRLAIGGKLIYIKFTKNGTYLTVYSFSMNTCLILKFENNIIFQKFTKEEKFTVVTKLVNETHDSP